MSFIIVPAECFDGDLTHADRTILFQLCLLCFRFVGSQHDKEFFCTDRDLASLTGTSTKTVYYAKKNLRSAGLISFEIGTGNKTYYKIPSLRRPLANS